jgi:hypothetical protein
MRTARICVCCKMHVEVEGDTGRKRGSPRVVVGCAWCLNCKGTFFKYFFMCVMGGRRGQGVTVEPPRSTQVNPAALWHDERFAL